MLNHIYYSFSINSSASFIADAQNYITSQHNVLGEWLHKNLCAIYEQTGGSCDNAIGPLQEGQSFFPVEFHWPEGQPSMVERLEQVHRDLSVINIDAAAKMSTHVNTSEAMSTESINYQLSDLTSELESRFKDSQTEMQVQVRTVEVKLSNMDVEVSSIEAKLSALEEKLEALFESLKVNEYSRQ